MIVIAIIATVIRQILSAWWLKDFYPVDELAEL
jgi:hypothetical protein